MIGVGVIVYPVFRWFLKMTIVMVVILIMMPGLVNADWSVTFENPNPCALSGSSVEFRCSYEYPDGNTVNKTAWFKGTSTNGKWARTDLSSLPSYRSRVEYLGDKQHNCNLVVHDLRDNDTGYYFFRFDTHRYGWRSRRSVHLSITGLTASVYPDSVTEGDKVTLQCITSCELHGAPNIVWFKDGHPVAKPQFQARAEHAGNYSCAVEGQDSMRSEPVALDVQYAPVGVLVEVSLSGSLAEGSSVNLTCSSAANPAVDSYTWYRKTGSPSSLVQVGSGQVLSLPSLEPSQTGLYLCQARNSWGENNSTELLLEMDMTETDHLILLVGIGVMVAVLVLPLVIFWAWRRKSAVDKEENSPDYENISGCRMASAGQDTRVEEEMTL